MAKPAKEHNHVDAIGRPLKIGDPVAVASSTTSLRIGRITAMGEKKIRVVNYGAPDKSPDWTGKLTANGSLRYPAEAVLLDGPDILMYLLKMNYQG